MPDTIPWRQINPIQPIRSENDATSQSTFPT
jgi:hypothetical protein